MREVWGNLTVRFGAANCVAAGTPGGHEDVTTAALQLAFRFPRGLAHSTEPAFEVSLGFDHDVESHVRVLEAAEFGALTAEPPQTVRAHPDGGGIAGDEIAFPLQVGRPEAVDDITRADLEHRGTVDRKVHFVSGHD